MFNLEFETIPYNKKNFKFYPFFRLNNCVGHRNHRHFFLYMVFMVVGCLFLMVFGFEIAWQEIMVSRLVNLSSRLFITDRKLRKESSYNFISDSNSFSDFFNALSGENGRSEDQNKIVLWNIIMKGFSVFDLQPHSELSRASIQRLKTRIFLTMFLGPCPKNKS